MARHFTLKKLKSKVGKTGKVILLLIAVIVALIVLFILRSREPVSKYSNPPGTIGNTAGNLNNGGTFCEYDGTVFFSNAFDDGCLYAMSPDEEDIHCISTAKVQSLLAGGNYLYYFQTGTSGTGGLSNIAVRYGFNRTDLEGKHAISVCKDVVVTAQLVNDYLYLVCVTPKGVQFRKILGDGTSDTTLAGYTINPASVQNDTIYYNGTQDNHYLYALDTKKDVPSQLLNISLWFPIMQGQYVYYIDVTNNYRLCRYNFTEEKAEVLTEDRVDCYNMGGGFIYYQKNGTDPQLICMRTDGTDKKAIADGNYTKINLTSRYVYFQEFESGRLYHSLLGSDTISLFDKAQTAAARRE